LTVGEASTPTTPDTPPPAPGNNAPTWENTSVDTWYSASSSTTVSTTDPDGDSTSIEFVSSWVSFWDIVISSATASGNTVSISVSAWSWEWYVEYRVKDSKWKYSDSTYKVTFNNLDWL
jgi:hypothetical protein